MDGELLLIFSFITIVLAITGLSVNGIVTKVLRHKKEMREFEHLANTKRTGGTGIADRTDLIEERLEVLERIATDRRNNLALEIEELRSNEALEAPSQTEGNA